MFSLLLILVFRTNRIYTNILANRENIIYGLIKNISLYSIEKNRIGGRAFEILARLGKECEPGKERWEIIVSFKELVENLMQNKYYCGDSFEFLIEELVDILVSNPDQKDLECYAKSAEIFGLILSFENSTNFGDKFRSLFAISKLVRTLLEQFDSGELENIILDYVDVVEFAVIDGDKLIKDAGHVLFEIGITALNRNRDFIAVAALEKLINIAENLKSIPNEYIAILFGFLSHFYVRKGNRQKYAKIRLIELEKLLQTEIDQIIEEAAIHNLRIINFETADNLDYLKKKWRKRKRG